MSTIKDVKIALFVGSADEICLYDTAKKIKNEIGDPVTYFHNFDEKDHFYFGSANDDNFMNKLVN